MKCHALATVLAGLTLATPAWAQTGPAFHPAANLSNSVNASDAVQLAADGASLFAVWRERLPAADVQQIRVRRSLNHGAAFAAPLDGVPVATLPATATLFSLRVAAAGPHVLILYVSGETPADAVASLVISADGGGTYHAPIVISEPGATSADGGVNATGEAHVAFAGAEGDIWYARSADGGVTFPPPVNLWASEAASIAPRVGVNGSQVAIVWQEDLADPEISLAYSSDGGVTFAAAVNVSGSPEPSRAPAVAVLGAIHVVWDEAGLLAHRQSSDAAAFSNVTAIGVPAPGETIDSHAISGVNTIVNIAWSSRDSAGVTSGPFLRRSNDGAATFISIVDLASGSGDVAGLSAAGGSPAKLAWSHAMTGEIAMRREIACEASWASPVNGLWTDAAKWSHGAVPGAAAGVCITVDGTYTVTITGSRAAGSVVVGAEGNTGRTTLRIEGTRPGTTSNAVPGALTVADGITNFHTLAMTDTGATGAGASLTIASGGLINAAGSLFQTLDGINGSRTVHADLINDGTVDLQQTTRFVKPGGRSVNNATFTIGTGESLTVDSGGRLIQAGGTLSVAGSLSLSDSTFDFDGGAINGNDIVMMHGALNVGPGSNAAAAFRLRGNLAVSGNIAAGQRLTVEGWRPNTTGAAIPAIVTMPSGTVNSGHIEITGTGAASVSATLAIPGAPLTNASGGVIETTTGDGGGRTIQGHVVNDGTLELRGATILTGLVHNNSAINAHGVVVTASSFTRFTQEAGALDLIGATAGFSMLGGGTFDFNGGAVTGKAALLTDSTLNFGTGSSGPGQFTLHGDSTLTGNLAAGQRVNVEGYRPNTTGAAVVGTVTVPADIVNAGHLQLTGDGVLAVNAQLILAGTLTNAATGVIETIAGDGGSRTITGTVINHGAIRIKTGSTISGNVVNHHEAMVDAVMTLTMTAGSTFTQNAGALSLAGSLNMTGGTFNFNGGSILQGAPTLHVSTLRFGAGSSGPGTLRMTGTGTLHGNIAAGQAVHIEGVRTGSAAAVPGIVTAPAAMTNAGRLRLTSSGTAASNAQLIVASGVLTNAAGGVIEAHQGAGGARLLTGNADNHGELLLALPTQLTAGTLRNIAPGTIAPILGSSGGSLTVNGGAIFHGTGTIAINVINAGHFHAGLSPGALSITGNFTQTATGSLNVEIGGFTAGAQYDQVAISGTATLAGALNVSLFGGFCEAGAFDVLTYAGGSGDFATKNGLNQGALIFTAARNAAFYRLNATGDCVTAPIANNESHAVNEDAVLNVAAPGVLSNDTDPQGTPLTAILFTSPSHGDVLLNPDGSFTYTPAANFFGTDSFAYAANDGSENSAPATVTITVSAVNDPPNAVDDAAAVDEDSGLNSVVVLVNDETAPDVGETLSIEAVTQGANGVVAIGGGGTSVTYTPGANFQGSDSFTYTVSDGNGGVDTATVVVFVTGVNDAPSLSGVHDMTVAAGSLASFVVSGSDVEGAVTLEASGLVGGAQFDPATGVFSWTPATPGVFPITFTARDGGGLSASGVAVITVTGGTNQAPSCSAARPSIESLWPPNGTMASVSVIGVTDLESAIAITITSISVNESGAEGDVAGVGTGVTSLRAKRAGGNKAGRVYSIAFTASDAEGASCSGQVTVVVPHDQGKR